MTYDTKVARDTAENDNVDPLPRRMNDCPHLNGLRDVVWASVSHPDFDRAPWRFDPQLPTRIDAHDSPDHNRVITWLVADRCFGL